jgi:hypothetical protein
VREVHAKLDRTELLLVYIFLSFCLLAHTKSIRFQLLSFIVSQDVVFMSWSKETAHECMPAGGIQSLPKVNFPGGCLLGCSAGMMNTARIKGTHTAMKSGMLAADAAFREIVLAGEDSQAPLHMNGYARQFEGSWVHHELTQACFNQSAGVSMHLTLLISPKAPTFLSSVVHIKYKT